MTLAKTLMTESEYLDFERSSDLKHEFYNGEIFAMAGAGRAHNVIAVLSDSTERYDRGKKFALYRELESLKEYVLVSSSFRKVEIFRRTENRQWLLTDADSASPVVLESVSVSLSWEDIYRKVEFTEPESLRQSE